ncbi:MAG: asparagine synthase (glutamine-hydrolyzing), partial [Pseudobdellovibrio sp.]
KGHVFSTPNSDTEVFVHGWREWGTELFAKLNGMFACAIWDVKNKSLCLARDRYGIKPLYISKLSNETLVFASEVRAIHASGLVEKAPDHAAVLEYLSVQNNWHERTPFKNVSLVKNGTFVLCQNGRISEQSFWNYQFDRSRKESLSDLVQEHKSLLQSAVKSQIAADVPVRSYLSGGIDSSAITAMAHKQDPTIETYSCIFNLENVETDRHFDEREFSRAMAQHMNAKRVEFEVFPNDLSANLENVVAALEYPMMGMSYVNYLIAGRVARDGKVVLSGTGGDEFHGGYLGRYQALPFNKNFLNNWKHRFTGDAYLQPGNDRHLDLYRKILNFLFDDTTKTEGLTPDFISKANGYSVKSEIDYYFSKASFNSYWDLLLDVDAKTYLHGLLVLEDKLSMHHSLETRVPLLDNNLIDFLSRVPWQHLNDGKTGKIIFRESVKDIVPNNIYNKPKMGFGPPDASWYKNHLSQWIREYLSDEVIRKRGIFKPEFVKSILDDHFQGKRNTIYWIWTLLCFEAWCNIHGFYGGQLK